MTFLRRFLRAFFLLIFIVTNYKVEPFAFMGALKGLKGVVTNLQGVTNKITSGDVTNLALMGIGAAIGVDIMNDNKQMEVLEDISNKVNEILGKLDKMESKIMNKLDDVENSIVKKLLVKGQIDRLYNQLANHIININRYYQNYLLYFHSKSHFNNHTKVTFVHDVISPSNDKLKSMLDQLHKIIVPGSVRKFKKSLLYLIGEQAKLDYLEACDSEKTVQEELFDIFMSVMIAEFRGYTVVIEAYNYEQRRARSSFKPEITSFANKSIEKYEEYRAAIKAAMKIASREIRRCKPYQYEYDENYLEFRNLFRTIIIQEADFVEDTCTNTCEEVSTKASSNCYDYKNYCAPECEGDLIDCTYSGSSSISLCLNKDELATHLWFSNDQTVFGSKNGDSCDGEEKSLSSWTRGIYSCDYCYCQCTLGASALRAIDIRPQTANIDKNKVVIGVKFVLKARMIHLQIEEGRLEVNGEVDDGIWKSIDNTKFTKSDKRFIDPSTSKQLIEDIDYVLLGPNLKTFNLDDVIIKKKAYVVTGVKLNQHKGAIQLEVQVTKFDLIDGKLMKDTSIWIQPEDTERNKLILEKPDDPTRARSKETVSRPSYSVDLMMSDVQKDSGKSTVPFLDSQDVEARSGKLLSGVGLFHRGTEGYGGFIGIRLFGLDMSQYVILKNESDKEEEEEEEEEEEDEEEEDEDDEDNEVQ